MITHKVQTKMGKSGYLEIRNLPFREGAIVDIFISPKEKNKKIDRLIQNSHVWTEEDIKSVEKGREIINKWKIF